MDVSVERVNHVFRSVVHLRVTVPREHPSTRILGDERLGSGVIVDSSGLILSVNYVVMGAQSIEVCFAKGRRAKAEIVAQDFEIGLALIRVKRQGLPAATLGSVDGLDRRAGRAARGALGAPAPRRAAAVGPD